MTTKANGVTPNGLHQADRSGRSGKRQNWDELVRTGPGTPMGTLLRSYWQPVAISADVAPGETAAVRILGDDLTLYRGASGAPYLVADRCAHRLTSLAVAWVEGECIRCFYHGWRYDGSGQCVETPGEVPTLARKVRIVSYPAQDYGGLVFAYLGRGEPPPLPRRAEIDRAGFAWTAAQTWPCNWFQLVENSLDGAHVSWTHRESTFGELITPTVPTLEYGETDWGLVQRTIRGPDNVRVSDYQWPNCNHIAIPYGTNSDGVAWGDLFIWKVPVDDEHTLGFVINQVPLVGAAARRFEEQLIADGEYDAAKRKVTYEPADHEAELFKKRMPQDGTFRINAQDYIAQVSQGRIVDRSRERLGRKDAGVILLRKVFRRELAAIKAGRPGKRWTVRPGPAELPLPAAGRG